MAIALTISADCKTLRVTGGPAGASYILYNNNFDAPTTIYELEDPTQDYNGNPDPATGDPINGYIVSSPSTLTGSGGLSLTYQNIGSASEESLNGVFMIAITDPVDPTLITTLGALGHCDIDCCIANKLTTLLSCSCDDDCNEALNIISKIYLLMKGSEVNIGDCLNTSDQFQKAYEKYAKAKSLCSSHECNCNC